MASRDAFFIGWQDKAPPPLARWVRAVVLVIFFTGAGVGLLLMAAQAPFAPSRFDFGNAIGFEGVLVSWPHPTLEVTRPASAGEQASVSHYYLVAPGKFGAEALLDGLEGHRVAFDATPVYRGDQTLLELVPDSIEDKGAASPAAHVVQDLGEQTLVGEIVDSKCFLGVMNPGNLKPHRACATRCISGGIPPLLLVRDEKGLSRQLLLVGAQGEAVNDRVLDLVAEPVEITGRLRRHHDLYVLSADPATYRRIN